MAKEKRNRKYKDSVFCDVFYSDQDAKANLLSLYNALYGTEYTDEKMIELVRLEDILFKNMKNDIAFIIGKQQIILGEHQSTVNENMPLRSLLYISREYEKLIPVKDRYRSKPIKVPLPEFFTFYNGVADYPAEMELRLSNAFFIPEEDPKLELKVKVININPEKKNPLLTNCRVLGEYSQFVEETRKYIGSEHALKQAVQSCIEKGILADYLTRKSSEVINMLMAEYDYDMDIAVQREESLEEGIHLTREAQKLHAQGKEVAEIARELEIPEDQVKRMVL